MSRVVTRTDYSVPSRYQHTKNTLTPAVFINKPCRFLVELTGAHGYMGSVFGFFIVVLNKYRES